MSRAPSLKVSSLLLSMGLTLHVHECVYQHDAKTTKRISMKLGYRMRNGPRKKPLKFGLDWYKGADPVFFL